MLSSPYRDDAGVAKYRHEVLAVVLRVGADSRRLEVLAWRREHEPFTGRWALPSGPVEVDESLDRALERHLAERVDLTALSHSEQLETFSDPGRDPFERTIATAYLGLVPCDAAVRPPRGVVWLDAQEPGEMAFDHQRVVARGVARLRAKMSYTNIAFALAPSEFVLSELREVYVAALGHDVDVTNLGRVLARRRQIVETGGRRSAGAQGGRPARLYRFVDRRYAVTDPFAVLKGPAA
ncbi:NUDIX hydrolase [Actinomyces radicidentis]|uniref:NUDIX hydrolase n=1 Tax=Actinomyces radicidentis TaxID=111015 RepID=UPI0012371FAC|nr:NUDIX domain-containing protein [Actinomyces radicidentis]